MQAVLVQVCETGVLIKGPPGSGKSMIALGLMDRGHKLVADDLVQVSKESDGSLTGSAVSSHAEMEIRGLGIFSADTLFADCVVASTSVDLVIYLDAYDPFKDAGRLVPDTGIETILGAELPHVRLPITNQASVPMLIELLARRFKENRGL